MIGSKVKVLYDSESFEVSCYGEKKQVSDLNSYLGYITGIVVDAYTNVSGSMKGENFLGFGEATGSVDSRRMYKVMILDRQDKKTSRFIDVSSRALVEVIELAPVMDLEKFIRL